MCMISSTTSTFSDLGNTVAVQSACTSTLMPRIDDLENRSRRSNLVICGIFDINGETWEVLEENVVALSKDKLGISIDVSNIGRAHRSVIFREGRKRTIIMKFSFFKTKQRNVSSSSKLKGTRFLSEYFSPTDRNAHRKLSINPFSFALIST